MVLWIVSVTADSTKIKKESVKACPNFEVFWVFAKTGTLATVIAIWITNALKS